MLLYLPLLLFILHLLHLAVDNKWACAKMRCIFVIQFTYS